jgi:tRNA(Arg) A34 adenosine deaminase TadA
MTDDLQYMELALQAARDAAAADEVPCGRRHRFRRNSRGGGA